VTLVVKDGSEPEAEQEDKPVENEENGEPDEEVKHFPYLCLLCLPLFLSVLLFSLHSCLNVAFTQNV